MRAFTQHMKCKTDQLSKLEESSTNFKSSRPEILTGNSRQFLQTIRQVRVGPLMRGRCSQHTEGHIASSSRLSMGCLGSDVGHGMLDELSRNPDAAHAFYATR